MADDGRLTFPVSIVGNGVLIIASGDVVTHKHALANNSASSNKAVGTNNGMVPDNNVFLNLNKGPHPDPSTQDAIVEVRR